MKKIVIYLLMSLCLTSTTYAVKNLPTWDFNKGVGITDGFPTSCTSNLVTCIDGSGKFVEESDLQSAEARLNAKVTAIKDAILQSQNNGFKNMLKSDDLKELIRQIIREEAKN